jgi:hypothetical protein
VNAQEIFAMSRSKAPHELRRLRYRLLLLEFLFGALIVLLMGIVGLTLVMSAVLLFLPLLALSAFGALGVILVWVMRGRLVGAARRRLAEADWLLTSAQPREAQLYFNQARLFDGVVCALLDHENPARHRAALLQFSKLDYPRQETTPITLFEDDICPTLLIRLNGRYFDGTRLDRDTFEAQKRRFTRLMNGVLIGTGLVFGLIAIRALVLEQNPGLALSVIGTWLVTFLLIRYLAMHLNRDRLQQIEFRIGWS